MGGATTLLTAAREPRIKAVVADSAWSDARRTGCARASVTCSSARATASTALSLKIAELRTGIDLDDLRPVEVIGGISPRPVMLIHGTADDVVVPPPRAERNFAAAKEPKELVLVPGAGHGDTIAPGEPSTQTRTCASSSIAPCETQDGGGMSASPWTRPEVGAPPMPEVVAAGQRRQGLGRLRRYTNLVKRSIHFKYDVARLVSRLLPNFASGIIRGRIYRWAGFDIGKGAFIMGNLHLTSAAPDFYSKLSIGEGATLADEHHDQSRREGHDRQERRDRAARRDLHGQPPDRPGLEADRRLHVASR